MFQEDLNPFVEDFGVNAIFTRSGNPIASTKMILDQPPFEMAVYDRSFYDEKFYAAKVDGSKIQLYGVEISLTGIRIGDLCSVNGNDMYVTSFTPDGTGMMFVVLSFDRV